MIVRILEDGQFEMDDEAARGLESLDAELEAAITNDDDERFHRALGALIAAVHKSGSRLDAVTIVPSDLALPAADSSLAEAHTLLTSEPAGEG